MTSVQFPSDNNSMCVWLCRMSLTYMLNLILSEKSATIFFFKSCLVTKSTGLLPFFADQVIDSFKKITQISETMSNFVLPLQQMTLISLYILLSKLRSRISKQLSNPSEGMALLKLYFKHFFQTFQDQLPNTIIRQHVCVTLLTVI